MKISVSLKYCLLFENITNFIKGDPIAFTGTVHQEFHPCVHRNHAFLCSFHLNLLYMYLDKGEI